MTFLIYGFFVISGMFGLVYEVIWDRYLLGFIGSTTYAHTIILTTFMGGLALGSWLFGRLSYRPLNGLRLYGWLEVGIGIYATIFPYLFDMMGSFYVVLAKPYYPQIAWLTLVRFLLCMALLLPPTFLMGGTLPILTNYLTNRSTSLRNRISCLYAANSSGAVLGTYLAGFWLISAFGLPMSLVGAGGINTLLGFMAILLSRSFLPNNVKKEEEISADDPDAVVYTPQEVYAAIIVAGLSGAITMALEVAWIRFWSLALGSSTYSFSIMLMAFISGIAIGSSLIASRFAHRRLTPMLFWIFSGTAAILLLGLPFYDHIPYWFARLRLWFANTHESYLAYQFVIYLNCFFFMFVPTLLSGMALPVAIRIASRSMERVGRDVGFVYAVNTIGTIVGSLCCGLILLSWLGLENTFRMLFICYLLSATLVWVLCERQRRWLLTIPVILAGIHFSTYVPWNQTVLNQGLYRQSQAPFITQAESWRQYLEILPALDINLRNLYEGHSASVAIFSNKNNHLSMFINGKVDAGMGDGFTQRMIGHLPLLAHPNAQEGLVIGLGTGSTAASIECYKIKRIDVVELHPEVVTGSHAFDSLTGSILSQPNVNLYVDDALHYLRMSEQKYDVIASEPTNPWQSGVGNLFTREYYELVSAHLKEGGILSQWIPTYETSNDVVYIFLRTITSVFPYVELFQMQNNDLLLLASHQPINPQLAMMQKRLAIPEVKKNLEDLGITTPAAIAVLHLASTKDFKKMLPMGLLNYLDYPSAEFKAPEPFFRRIYSDLQDRMDTRLFLRPKSGLWWSRMFGNRMATAEELQSIRASAVKAHNDKIFWKANRALMLVKPWEELPDDLSILHWQKAAPGLPCKSLNSYKKISVKQLAGAYKEEKRKFFDVYSVFYRSEPNCPIILAKKLLELDDRKQNFIWHRELGMWSWIQGDTERSAKLLQIWFNNRPNGHWDEDDMEALRILVRALIKADQESALVQVLTMLQGLQKIPEDFLTIADAIEYLHSKKN